MSVTNRIGMGSPTHSGECEVWTTGFSSTGCPNYKGGCRLRSVNKADEGRQSQGNRGGIAPWRGDAGCT